MSVIDEHDKRNHHVGKPQGAPLDANGLNRTRLKFVTEIIEREYGKTFYFHDPNGIRLQIELQTSESIDDLTGDPDPVPMVRELSSQS